MTIGRVRIGHKKILQKVSPKNDLLQHFNNSRVFGWIGRVCAMEKPDVHRIKTGHRCAEIFDY
jgi:hypothetical protein